jgi:putative heme-binding domain-containing protein
MMQTLITTARDGKAPVGQRVDAIETLSYGTFDRVGNTLQSLIDNREPAEVQAAAIASLSQLGEGDVTGILIEVYPALSPQLREIASEALFARPARTLAWFDAVDAGRVPVSSLALGRLQAAANAGDEEVKSRARGYIDARGLGRRDEIVAQYQAALDLDGDVDRGRGVFRKHCSACHRVEDAGHEIGPNLATIKTRGPETILVNVLDPSREVNPQYLNYVALTIDGRSVTGMIVSETASSVTLQRAENANDTILRNDIEQLQSTGLSMMPEGLEQVIDLQSMADLIAYLMRVP